MGKKKRGHPDVEEILARPWCYYCERDFDDLKILTMHQKAKHFKCERCGRRLNTAGGLSVHMSQVHKENLSAVDNALPNRAGLDIEIFGMEGIPEDIIQQHQQRVLRDYHQAEADRRAASGNPASGGADGNQVKKPKIETTQDLKARLAAHKAARAAQAAGGNSGSGTPHGAGQNQVNQHEVPAPSDPFAHPYGQSSPSAGFPPSGFPQAFSPPTYVNQQPSIYAQPQYAAQPQYPNGQSGIPLGAFGPTSPPQAYPQQQLPVRNELPQHMLQQRSASLPDAPGLPQRPAFGTAQVNAFDMQRMHQGQLPQTPVVIQPYASQVPQQQNQQVSSDTNGEHAVTASGPISTPTIDTTPPKVVEEPDIAPAITEPPAVLADDTATKKEKSKSKGKPTRMVYTDEETSPEEKMARMPRYAFTPQKSSVTA